MDEFLEAHYRERRSIRELPVHVSGGLRRASLRGADIFAEMHRK
jgi:hypothetical protein